MAINIKFNGANIKLPGYYGDPKAHWYTNPKRKPLLLLLAKLGITKARHYSYDYVFVSEAEL